jgi:S-DNA-T family DNA segregation ATPase FtsK/SpoIIIE
MANKKENTRSGWNDVWGIVLLVFCAFFLLGLISYDPADVSLVQAPPNRPPMNLIGPAGAWITYSLVMLLGLCAYPFSIMVGIQGGFLLFRRHDRTWPKAVWMAVLLLALICLTEIQNDLWTPVMRALNIANPGGILGMILAQNLFIRFIGVTGTAILAIAAMVISLIFLFDIESLAFMAQIMDWLRAIPEGIRHFIARHRQHRDDLETEARELERKRKKLEKAMRAKERSERRTRKTAPSFEEQGEEKMAPRKRPEPKPEPETSSPDKKPLVKRTTFTKPQKKHEPKAEQADLDIFSEETPPALSQTDYKLPSYALLDPLPPAKEREVDSDTAAGAKALEDTLSDFGIEAEVTHVEVGPVVTSYEVLPAPGVRVERIVRLSNNIALSMKALSIRVQAPIPGKGVVGIEVPNEKSTMVYLREILESKPFTETNAALPLVLGKDVSGRDLVTDLAKMPHMLIAGATGSGKSVCMNSLLAGLLMSRTPEQMRLMLVDPKMVEFSFFNNLPHLVVPVITDPKKVALGLRWAINEMEKRYKLFAKTGVRNIQAFNKRPIATQKELFDESELGSHDDFTPTPPKKDPDRLPYIVIVIDELADLMMVAQADVENAIARLAQLSRAVGIHMIIATQRPSVNVITGTIKANFPARIAFQTAQGNDSKTILDTVGAEKLLGKGDMLFLPPATSKLMRAQGTMTTDREIREIVDFWKNQDEPHYETAIKDRIENPKPDLPEQDDDKDSEILDQAVEVIRQTKRASTSSLQRRLRIGYTRAARLMDIMEERGIIGPPNGSDPREILIDLDGDIPSNDSA